MRRKRVGEIHRTRDCEAAGLKSFRGNVRLCRPRTKSHCHLRLHHEFFRRSVNKIEAGPVNDFEVRRESLRRCSQWRKATAMIVGPPDWK